MSCLASLHPKGVHGPPPARAGGGRAAMLTGLWWLLLSGPTQAGDLHGSVHVHSPGVSVSVSTWPSRHHHAPLRPAPAPVVVVPPVVVLVPPVRPYPAYPGLRPAAVVQAPWVGGHGYHPGYGGPPHGAHPPGWYGRPPGPGVYVHPRPLLPPGHRHGHPSGHGHGHGR